MSAHSASCADKGSLERERERQGESERERLRVGSSTCKSFHSTLPLCVYAVSLLFGISEIFDL